MYNWRLLLLALVAVVQPIASFTERNLVDGRQQCCDRQTNSILRDTRSSLHEIQQFTKASSPLRRLNFRDENREDRRYELRQRDTLSGYHSSERSLLENRERDSRRSRSTAARPTRLEYTPERIAFDQNRERRLDVQRRERNVEGRRSESIELNRRVAQRFTRDSLMRYDENEVFSRRSVSRDDRRISRFRDERQTRDSQDERMISARTGDLRRFSPTRHARDLSRAREDVVRIDGTIDNRQRNVRERNVVRRDVTSRADVRRFLDNNNERRTLERDADRSYSENSRTTERVGDMRIRVNSRDDQRDNRERVVANRRLMTERFGEQRQQMDDFTQFREQIRETVDRRLTSERMDMDRRDIRDSRLMNDRKVRLDRAAEDRRVNRNSERHTRETRDEQARHVDLRESRRMSVERDNRLMDRRARSIDSRNFRDVRAEPKLSHSVEPVRERDASRRQVEYRNKVESRERDLVDNRYRQIDTARIRDMTAHKIENENPTTTNWQYVFYMLQGAYLCGLLMQMMSQNHGGKAKRMDFSWPLSSKRLVKVD